MTKKNFFSIFNLANSRPEHILDNGYTVHTLCKHLSVTFLYLAGILHHENVHTEVK